MSATCNRSLSCPSVRFEFDYEKWSHNSNEWLKACDQNNEALKKQINSGNTTKRGVLDIGWKTKYFKIIPSYEKTELYWPGLIYPDNHFCDSKGKSILYEFRWLTFIINVRVWNHYDSQ